MKWQIWGILCVTSVKSFLSDSSQTLLRVVYLFLSSPKLMLLVYQIRWKEAKDKDVSQISPVDEAWIIVIISSSYPYVYIYIYQMICLWNSVRLAVIFLVYVLGIVSVCVNNKSQLNIKMAILEKNLIFSSVSEVVKSMCMTQIYSILSSCLYQSKKRNVSFMI